MRRSAILIATIIYCAQFLAQDLRFTRNFQTLKKNIPLAIVNKDPAYFYVLRYNKLAHDMIIERRRKPSGEVITFTPLRLDSVNARWFNYENLDYLFFADATQAFFVFEKVINNRRSVFVKSVDTSGNTGGFREICAMERLDSYKDFYFMIKRSSGGNVLITGSRIFENQTASKMVFLYDPFGDKLVWTKKLPPENAETGYSSHFETDAENNLFYVMIRSRILKYRRQYANHMQTMRPVYHFDSLSLVKMPAAEGSPVKRQLDASDFSDLNSIKIFAGDSTVNVSVHFGKEDTAVAKDRVYFLNQGFSSDLALARYSFFSPLKKEIDEQLDFYDGGDSRTAANKLYEKNFTWSGRGYTFQLSDRKEDHYFKEMLFWKSDTRTGMVDYQAIVPRKVFFYGGRTRFRNLGSASTSVCGDRFFTFVLEHRRNERQDPEQFDFRKYTRQQYETYANVVCYSYRQAEAGEPASVLEKKVILRNIDYDCIPLHYEGDQCDMIFFQSRGAVERFAILKLNPL